jgi:NTE family protein
VFGGGILGQLGTLARHGTHLHGNDQLRRLIDDEIGGRTFADLPVRFQCVAANIERAAAHWFVDGPVTDAVLASCAVPGLLPPVEIGGQHYLDGGLVSSVPVGRAVGLGARRIYVLQVGRLERPLAPPTRPWQVGLVAFEISRRHRFAEDMAAIPDGVEVVLLPSGTGPPSVSVRYRNPAAVPRRIDAAYGATTEVLGRLDGRPS